MKTIDKNFKNILALSRPFRFMSKGKYLGMILYKSIRDLLMLLLIKNISDINCLCFSDRRLLSTNYTV